MTETIFGLFQETPRKVVSSLSVHRSGFRLDAAFHCVIGQEDSSGLKTLCLGEYAARVFNPPIFKRAFQAINSNGCQYFASSEIVLWNPAMTHITEQQAQELNLHVSTSWVLVTGYGTIGSIRIVDKMLDGCAVADNVARIIPRNPLREAGFLAAFLQSKYGHSLLNKMASGSVVRYIRAPDIAKVPIPLLPLSVVEEINNKYLKSVACREMAERFLYEANNHIYKICNLVQLEPPTETVCLSERRIQVNTVPAINIGYKSEQNFEYRLDAHFYNPMAQLAVTNIKKCGSEVKTLEQVVERVHMGPRFKRNYVESAYGVPFLSGKNIIQIRPTDLKYLSDLQMADMQELIVKQEWTLITRSGTIGRTCFVWKNFEDYAASEHILRVIPNKSEIDPGYLYAFLSSRYGYEQVLRYRYGSVIDEVTDKQIERVLVPCPSRKDQEVIGDMVREAYEKRADAIRLEDEAQAILMKELTKSQGNKGV